MSFGMDKLIEERIRNAQKEGVFDKLPGQGQPLDLDDDLLIPEELRMVCRVLKNSGYVPPEVEELRELRQLEAILATGAIEDPSGDEAATQARRLAARKRMELLLIKLEQSGMARVAQAAWDEYAEKVAERMAGIGPEDAGS